MKKATIVIIIITFLGIGFYILKKDASQTTKGEIISPLGKSSFMNTLGDQDNRDLQKELTIYGYLPYWTVDEIDNIRLENLSDVAYFGLYINSEGDIIKSQEAEEDGEKVSVGNPGYSYWHNSEKLANFIRKAKRQNVNIALTIISHVDSESTEFLNCEECWKNFYKNLKDEMKVHDIDSVNLNFEYYEEVDKEIALKYSKFTQYIKKELNKDFEEPEIVVTTFADSLINNRVSDVPSLAKIADRLFIMAYDFHIMSADKAAPVSPMGGSGLHAGYDIKTMIKDYLSYVPPQKLILGVPYYGFNWAKGEERIIEEIEENPNEHDDNPKDENEDDDEDKKVEIIKDSITQTYSEIITNIEELNAEVQWDEPGQVPFYEYVDEETQKTRKVYFENEKSLSVKYQIAKEFDLAGVGIWALGYDGDRPELWKLLDTEFNLK